MIQVKVFYPSPSPHLKVCIWALIVLAMSCWWSTVYFVENVEFFVVEFLSYFQSKCKFQFQEKSAKSIYLYVDLGITWKYWLLTFVASLSP